MHALADRVPAALAVPDARGVRGHAEGPEAAESQLLADLYERAAADDGRGGPFDRVALAAGAAAGAAGAADAEAAGAVPAIPARTCFTISSIFTLFISIFMFPPVSECKGCLPLRSVFSW